MIGNSDDEINLSHQLWLTNRHFENPRKAFANSSSTAIKLSKTQLSNVIRSEGLPGPLLKTGLPSIKNLIKPLIKVI